MKKIVTFLVVMMSTQLGHAAQNARGFVCENLAYKYAEVKYIANQELSILDSKVKGQEEFKRVLADSLKTDVNKLEIASIQVSINPRFLDCSSPVSYAMFCRTSKDELMTDALITVKGNVSLDSGLYTSYTLSFKAHLENFDFRSSLESDPGIILNGKGKTVGFSHVRAVTKLNAIINNQAVELEWNNPFKLAKKSENLSSSCEVLN